MSERFTVGEHVWALVEEKQQGTTNEWQECILLEEEFNASNGGGGRGGKVQLSHSKQIVKALKLMKKNPDSLIGTSNLVQLSLMNEQEVLRSLKTRYLQDLFYTRSGLLMISVNPFKQLPGYYSWETRAVYRKKSKELQTTTNDILNQSKNFQNEQATNDLFDQSNNYQPISSSPEPHLYEIAQAAFTRLTEARMNQSIIISGESGSGKTFAARLILQFLTEQQHQFQEILHHQASSESTQLERMILATNPLLESLGNAKTQRNNNSSRFGKFIKLEFQKDWSLAGASIKSFLLEKSRACFHAPGERNFHIFYQMIAGCESYATGLAKELRLEKNCKFAYLEPVCGPFEEDNELEKDSQGFKEFMESCELFGLSSSQRMEILRCLAGILHLGNVQIKGALDDSSIDESDFSLETSCDLLGFPDKALLIQALTQRNISTSREGTIVVRNSREKACEYRDALAKFIYESLFNWIVSFVNSKISISHSSNHHFIGILDVYGFEFFTTNSLEQFCINYANEKLQQEFYKHFFSSEQQLYQSEGISMDAIQYSDNQACIDLIEGKGGIIDQLDEQSRLASIGTDQKFRDSLFLASNSVTSASPCLFKPKMGNSTFGIRHFASEVQYECEGFLEKNRDSMPDGLVALIKASKLGIIQEIAVKLSSAVTANKKSVLSSFRDSLKSLIQTLHSTESQYIRCIKPNDKSQNQFDPKYTLGQLISCGILESVKMAMQGFPTRKPFKEFLDSFGVLSRQGKESNSRIQSCFEAARIHQSNWAIGKTQVFMKIGVLAQLEVQREAFYQKALSVVFALWRAKEIRKNFLKSLALLKRAQSTIKCQLKRLEFKALLRNSSLLQRIIHNRIIRRILKPLLHCQRAFRAHKTKSSIDFHVQTLRLQSLIRVWQVKANFSHILRCIQIQRAFRRNQRFKTLKSHLQSKYSRIIQREILKFLQFQAFHEPTALRKARFAIAQTKKRQLDAKLAKEEAEAQKAAQELADSQRAKRQIQAAFEREIKDIERQEREIDEKIAYLQDKLVNCSNGGENKNSMKARNWTDISPSRMMAVLKRGVILTGFWVAFDTLAVYLTRKISDF